MEKLRAKEQYKRLVKLSFAVVMIVGLCMMYGVTWIGYYNRFILQEQYRFFRRGNWLVVLLYGILLIFFMNTYGGFKVGYLKKGNLHSIVTSGVGVWGPAMRVGTDCEICPITVHFQG